MATKGKVRDILKILRRDGWFEIKSGGGDHRHFKHPTKSGRVTVDGKANDDVSMDNWYSMLKQAGLR